MSSTDDCTARSNGRGDPPWHDPAAVRQTVNDALATRAAARELAREADELIALAMELRRLTFQQIEVSRALLADCGRLLATAGTVAPPPVVVIGPVPRPTPAVAA